jgi:hypothetical protein
MSWYTPEEIRYWLDAPDKPKIDPDWMAAQLNLAFDKGEQIGRGMVMQAFGALQADPHQWSTRPCQTCRIITGILGEPFGCDLYREQRKGVKCSQ